MSAQTFFAPAKLNLFLAITGRRTDGFHDLVSVVVPIAWGDTLHCEPAGDGAFSMTCTDPDVPCDESNLVLKAARAFVKASGWRGGVAFRLEKRVPMGAGLGGGSSDGVAALRALNALAGAPLDAAGLLAVAATLGSDCPLFLHGRPLVMRGRGERIELLPEAAAARLRGRRVLVFKPAFGIPTAWSYRRLAELAAGSPGAIYRSSAEAETQIATWISDPNAKPESLFFNTLEQPAFGKYVALPALLDQLRRRFDLAPRMTGSGSACFTLLPDRAPMDDIAALIRAAWGDSATLIDTRIT